MKPISPAIDPLSQRAAIEAMEAQRAAYRRFAQQAEAQQGPLSRGDMDQVAEFTDSAATTVGELHDGAHRVKALFDRASSQSSDVDLRELERRMSDMTREARNAEVAIRNLTTQLEAWRDAYGRQLSELGVTTGTTTSGASSTGSDAIQTPPARGYGQRDASRAPRLLDRKG